MNTTRSPIDPTLYPMMPDPDHQEGRGGYYYFENEDLKGFLHYNAGPVHPDGYLVFPYALIVFDSEGRHLYSAVVEQTDYRLLSSLTRTPVKELSGGSRRTFSEPQLALYSSAGHEVFQAVEEPYSEEEAVTLLLDVILDVLDSLSDPVFIGTGSTSR